MAARWRGAQHVARPSKTRCRAGLARVEAASRRCNSQALVAKHRPVSSSPGRCDRCRYALRVCLCAEIPTIATRTRIVIVRHSQERNRSSNSGRLAHLALPNSLVVEHGGFDRQPAQLPALEGAWLLFPVGAATSVPPTPPPSTLLVLDATWSQARRMYRRLPVHQLPVLHLAGDAMAKERLRRSPGPGQLSTIESIAHALRMLEGQDVAAPLERLFEVAVSRAIASGRNRTLGKLVDAAATESATARCSRISS